MINHLKTKLQLSLNEVIADRAYGVEQIITALEKEGIKNFIPLFSTRSWSSSSTSLADFQYDTNYNRPLRFVKLYLFKALVTYYANYERQSNRYPFALYCISYRLLLDSF